MNQTTNLKDFLLLGLRGGSRLPYLANNLKKKKNCLFGCAGSWLALRVLSCDMRTLSCMCEILIPQPRTKPAPPALKGRFLTAGLIGKSLVLCPIRKLFQKKKESYFRTQDSGLPCLPHFTLSRQNFCPEPRVGRPLGHICVFPPGLPFAPPGDLPDPGIKPPYPASPAVAGRFFTSQ